jgi:hypothetical protein
MNMILYCRAMAAFCRQHAHFEDEDASFWIEEAIKWDALITENVTQHLAFKADHRQPLLTVF